MSLEHLLLSWYPSQSLPPAPKLTNLYNTHPACQCNNRQGRAAVGTERAGGDRHDNLRKGREGEGTGAGVGAERGGEGPGF